MTCSLDEMRGALLRGMLTGELDRSALTYVHFVHHFGKRWDDISNYLVTYMPDDIKQQCKFVLDQLNSLYPVR